MNLKLFVIVMFSAMLITVGVGNLLTAPAASPCDNGQCTLSQSQPPAVVPSPGATCDGDCAVCPIATCPDNLKYTEDTESSDCDSCRKPLRKAGKAIIKAPLKAAGRAGRIAVKPLKVFRLLRRR